MNPTADPQSDPPAEVPIVWINGSLRDPAAAGLSWSDHGITVGDGVFETIKVTNAGPFGLDAHLDRLARSASGLGLVPPDRATIEAGVTEAFEAWAASLFPPDAENATGRLRLTVTGGPGPAGSERGSEGPTLMVTVGAMALRRDPTPVVVVPWTRNESGALAGLKTTSYAENVVALAHASARGASEAIFANTRGELCEGTGTNVFLADRGRLVTPPLDSGCLDGVTRRFLMEALDAVGAPVLERPVPLGALVETEEAFLTSTGREVQPISVVDDVELPTAPGPLTLAAQQAWDSRYG